MICNIESLNKIMKILKLRNTEIEKKNSELFEEL